jgi:hypothetical protein
VQSKQKKTDNVAGTVIFFQKRGVISTKGPIFAPRYKYK